MRKERNISLDRYRGIIVFSMIFFQFIENFKKLGVFSTIAVHAPNCFPKSAEEILNGFKGIFILPNLTLADLIAPAFIFAIGFTLVMSYNRRKEKEGKAYATKSLLLRYLVLTGIGVMFSSINVLLDGQLMDKCRDYLDIPVFAGTIIVLILLIVNAFLKNKKISKTLNYIVASLGIIGITVSLVNTLGMGFGLTEENMGYWGTLQHIGLAGVFAVMFIALSKKNTTLYRVICGILIIGVFTVFHETALPILSQNAEITNNMQLIDQMVDGGFPGAFAYSGVLLLFTALADVYFKDVEKFRKIVISLIIPTLFISLYAISTFNAWDGTNKIFTAGLSEHLSINKGSISPSFLIITLFTSSFAFLVIDLFKEKKFKLNFFNIWGKNPLLMYILEFGFIGALTAFMPDSMMSNASVAIAIIETVIVFGILTFIGYKLYKKDKVVKI